jgi:predicted acyltransferase
MIKPRFRSLDVFRGMTVALMILVNNPGSWSAMYAPLQHASWHGCTPTDLVFPFFLFAVGNALALVMPGLSKKGSSAFWSKVLKRVILIFGIGLLLNLSPFVRWDANDQLALKAIDTLRILGVLQRIALAFGFAAAIVWFCDGTRRPNLVVGVASVLLVVYWLAFFIPTGGKDPFSLEGYFGTHLDRLVLGAKHLYMGEGVPFDPEGIASTVPSISQVLLGWWVGKQIIDSKLDESLTTRLFVTALIMFVVAYVWQWFFPLNKKIWSSSFVLWTSSMAIALLATLVHWIEKPVEAEGEKESGDVQQRKVQTGFANAFWTFFEAFGKNPLFIFVLSGLVPRLLGLVRWREVIAIEGTSASSGWKSPLPWLYEQFFANLANDPRLGSLAYSVFLLAIYAAIVLWMDHRKIYVRV